MLLIALGIGAYFGYHTIEGRHGLKTRMRLIERSKTLEREIGALEAVRSRIEREIALLDADHPDLDYVDELARQMLGFADPRDRLILLRPAPYLPAH